MVAGVGWRWWYMMLYADDGGIEKNKKILKNKCIQKLCVQKLNYKNHKTWKIKY